MELKLLTPSWALTGLRFKRGRDHKTAASAFLVIFSRRAVLGLLWTRLAHQGRDGGWYGCTQGFVLIPNDDWRGRGGMRAATHTRRSGSFNPSLPRKSKKDGFQPTTFLLMISTCNVLSEEYHVRAQNLVGERDRGFSPRSHSSSPCNREIVHVREALLLFMRSGP